MTLNDAIKILKDAGVDFPEYDAEELFHHFGGYPYDVLLFMRNINSDSPELIDAVIRRAAREPLQYILGEVGFYYEEYKVTPACLIPRSDTETLVDYAVKNIPEGACFVDLCTGSGCVAISTLKNTKDTHAIALDLSTDALEIARENAEMNGVSDRIEFIHGDALSEAVGGEIYALLSNPPYVADKVYDSLEGEIFYEPKMAFLGGEDGGDFYRTLTPMYCNRIAEGGFIAYEIGYDQADLLRSIAEENNMSCQILRDLSDNDREAILRRK